MLFEVLADGVLIGHSELEMGDPPMGVAFGALKVVEAYYQFQPVFRVSECAEKREVKLMVRAAGSSDELECCGIGVADYSDEVAVEPIQIEVFGISSTQYEKYFPHHIASYEQQFRKGGV